MSAVLRGTLAATQVLAHTRTSHIGALHVARRRPGQVPLPLCYLAARKADDKMAATCDRWWSETLMALDGQPAGKRAEMLKRMSIIFEILVDRRGWLAGRMQIDRPPRERLTK
jgi:hypothetical protein